MERRSSEIEDASALRSKRRPLVNRRARIIFYSKEPFLFSKAGILYQKLGVTQESRGVLFSNFVVICHVQLGALRKPRAEPGFEPRFSKDHHSSLSSLAVSFAEITGRFVRKRVTGTVHPSPAADK